MKKSIISLAIAAGLVASMPAAHAGDVKVKWFGFAQITAQQLNQNDQTTPATDSLTFGADRVRFGFKIKDGNVFGKLQADLNKTDSTATPGTLPQVIKDIEAGYKFSNAASVKVGQFKTPVGMDFNTSGKKLDITKRGMEKKLVMERAVGIMLSGRKIANGFGYDLFFGNPATRGSASPAATFTDTTTTTTSDSATFNTTTSTKEKTGVAGDANSYAARVMYDMGKMMHVELGYGVDENSLTGPGTDDYSVIDLGFRMKMAAMTIKFEYIDGTSVKGVDGNDETVWYGHFAYNLNKTTELLVRHYQSDADIGASSTTLTNTYLGANFFLGSNKTNGRIQLNYVISGGDDAGSATPFAGTAKGYTDDAFLAQYQVSF